MLAEHTSDEKAETEYDDKTDEESELNDKVDSTEVPVEDNKEKEAEPSDGNRVNDRCAKKAT